MMELCSNIADIDLQLAMELKNKYPEHFQNLVRMHLSFALELNLEENEDQTDNKMKPDGNKWSFCRKTKSSKDTNTLDGNILTEAKIARMYKLMHFLSQDENISQEGIFRKTGAVSRQLQLKTCLNEGVSVDFNDNNFSVHDCASVLKNFLSELPEPLVTDAYYPLYCQISEWCKCDEFQARLLRSLQLLLLLLPSNNALLIKYVINLLHLTAKRAEKNKMSAENLSTLFTPHLLCPRKLAGEVLHTNAQMLYQIVAFMIETGPELFKVPAGLAADIRLYWHEKEKKKLSPKNCLNESTADSCVVNTVFSFVDREKTAQENVTNPTETALAQLYAHIQSLPESSKKRKLVKQFNKENGYGTPKRVLLNNNDKHQSLTKNISDSLKKHIFSKTSTSKPDKSTKFSTKNKHDQNTTPEGRFKSHPMKLFDKSLDCMECVNSDVSDDVCGIKKLDDNDVIERQEIQERLISSGSQQFFQEEDRNCEGVNVESAVTAVGEYEQSDDCEGKNSRQIFQTPICIKQPTIIRKNSVLNKLGTPTTSNTVATASHFHGTLTSTPAAVCHFDEVLTPSPFGGSNDDMSPITMSAQKMPKSMQEVMMTPRSRQPVLAVSGSNNTNPPTKDKTGSLPAFRNQDDETKSNDGEHYQTCFDNDSKDRTNLSNQSADSLTDTFREYLYNRSMLTTSIVDDSFSSRTGDYDPSSMSEDKLSDSLLYCLDGGETTEHRERDCYDESHRVCKDSYENDRVHETLL